MQCVTLCENNSKKCGLELFKKNIIVYYRIKMSDLKVDPLCMTLCNLICVVYIYSVDLSYTCYGDVARDI